MSKYVRTTYDEWRIMVNYGFGDGWEWECTEFTSKAAKEQLKAYRENAPQYPVKAIKKRVKLLVEWWTYKEPELTYIKDK